MRSLILMLACALTSSLPIAPARAADPTSFPDLVSNTQGDHLEVVPPKGHHFNTKAPATAAEGARAVPFKLLAQKLTLTLPVSATEQDVAVEVYVCDDANTFCKKKGQTFKVPPVAVSSQTPRKSGKAALKPVAGHFEKDTNFYVNDPKKAFAEAAKKKLPLMIDFYGIWCPPCNHIDAMVFRSAEFRKKTDSRFVKLKIDSDHDQFNELKNRYKLQFLPTVVLATASGDEIFRLVGYHPLDEMLAKADAAYLGREEGFEQLSTKATGGNAEARYRAARIALDRDEPAKALEWLTPLRPLLEANHDPRLADFYRAQVGTARAASDKKLERQTLEAWLKDFPESPDALENYESLADMQEAAGEMDASKATLAQAIALADKLFAAGDGLLKGSYFTQADVAEFRADLVEKQGNAAKTKEAYLSCAAAYHKEAVAEGTDYPRGPNLEQAYCLGKAGEVAKSEALYKDGIRRFPGEYTFYQGLAKLWLETKDPAKALPEAKKAVHFGYGNQRLKAMVTLARAYEGLKQPKEAIEAIEAELNAPTPGDATASTIKLREKLRAKAEELRKKSVTAGA